MGGKQVDLALKNVIFNDSFSRTDSDILMSRITAAFALRYSLAYFVYLSFLCIYCFSGSFRVTGSLILALYSFRGETLWFFIFEDIII